MKRFIVAIVLFLMTALFVACVGVVTQNDVDQDDVSYVDDEMLVSVVPILTEDKQYWENRLNECKAVEDIDCEIAVYREKYDSGDAEAGFKMRYFYSLIRDFDNAYAVLDEIGEDYPELMGRAVYNKGGIAVQADDLEKAKEFFELVADEYGDLLLGGNPVGIVALKELAAWTAKTDQAAGGEIYRRIIYEYSDHFDDISGVLVEAIVYESIGTSLDGYAYGGACGVADWNYCLFADGEVTASNEVFDGFVSLSDSESAVFWFKLSEEDQAILDQYQ